MSSHKTNDMFCPNCAAHFDRALNWTEPQSAPKVGDVSVCIQCAHVLTFEPCGDRLRLRELKSKEILQLPARVVVQALCMARAVVECRRKFREQGGEHG